MLGLCKLESAALVVDDKTFVVPRSGIVRVGASDFSRIKLTAIDTCGRSSLRIVSQYE